MGTTLTFGEWLEDRYLTTGYTQTTLADAIGVSQSAVSGWVRNESLPTRTKYAAVARALDISYDDLRDRVEAEKRRRRSERPQPTLAQRVQQLEQSLNGTYQHELEVRPEDIAHGAQRVSFWGRVPADTLRWVASQSEGERVTVPGLFIGTREIESLFVVQASGDCLIRRRIADGQLVLCEKPSGRLPRNNQVVAIRVGDERSLKVFHRDGDTITLRDGDNNITATLTIDDDIEVVGFVIATWWGQFD